MLQRVCYSTKIKSAKMYTLEIYPLYGILLIHVAVCIAGNFRILASEPSAEMFVGTFQCKETTYR